MSGKLFEPRSSAGFPSKFSALPNIGGADSPTPVTDNQLIPYGGGNGPGRPGVAPSNNNPGGDERVRQLETRVNVAERSNRALLEEVVRLQSELKGMVRRNEEQLREERSSRQQLENSLRISNDLVAQMSTRLQRTEDKLQEEKGTVSQLANQSKTLEQSIVGNQQEMLSRRDLQAAKIQELQTELGQTSRAKDQLERVTYQLVDELRQVKSRVDTQGLDVTALINDLKSKSHRLEEENRQAMDSMRKHGETQNQTEQNTSQLRSQVENRLSELRDVVVELRNKTDQEIQERRMLEQAMQLRLSDVAANIAEQNRRREESMHALDVMQREKEHAAETERIKLQSKIAEIAEEVSKKILQKEMKLREENQSKFAQLEGIIMNEQENRQRFERENREETEQRWDSLKKVQDDDLRTIRELQKNEKKKNSETLHKLNEACNLLERQLEEQRKQQEKLMAAEILSRKQHEKNTVDKIDDLQQKIAVATATLQQAIGGMSGQMSSQSEKMRKDMHREMEESQAGYTRQMADMDARLGSLQRSISSAEDMLEAKIAAASAIQSDNLREKIAAVLLWQDTTQQAFKELQKQNSELQQQLDEISKKEEKMSDELEKRVSEEAESRIIDVENLKVRIEELSKHGGGSNEELEALQKSIRKLAESIQTVKTVLGMKIQSEQKVRTEEVKDLEEDLSRLRQLVEKLHDIKPEPRIFIKPEDWDEKNKAEVEKDQPEVNQWSMYTAYRWLHLKQRWMYLKWTKDANQHNNKSPTHKKPNKK